MAKTIKAIVCPQCGSNNKTELKSDYYICNSCKTEYFLDNDDITIIHRNSEPASFNTTTKTLKPFLIYLGVFFAISSIFLANFITSSSSSSNNFSYSTSENIDLDSEEMAMCSNKKDELLFVTVGIERTGSYDNWSEKLVAYFDDSKGKQLKKQVLDFSVPKNKNSFPIRKKNFSTGTVYFIFNDKTLFEVNPNSLELIELKEKFFNAPEFSFGIAKIEEEYKNDGFKILTQNGKSFTFLPVINKIIPTDQVYSESQKIPPAAVNTALFHFTGEREGANYLVKSIQQMQKGYLNDDVYFDVKDNAIKARFRPNNMVSFENFLPDRIFFNPDVLGLNDELLVIRFTLDASDNAAKQIQALDVKTGKIRWTFDCSTLDQHVNCYPYESLSNKKVTLVETNFEHLVIDNKTGKVVATVARK